jgi:transcriptional regulator with XRE-family HTH domain
MTQQEIAEKADISQQMVSYIINGDRTPSIEVAVKLE